MAPIVLLFARYGVDTFVGVRSSLGYRGTDLFFIMFVVINLGWVTIPSFMLGESVNKILGILGAGTFWTSRETGAPIFAVIAYIIALYVAYKGPVAIKWFVRIGVPAIVLLLVLFIGIVFFKEGLQKVFSAPATDPYESLGLNRMSAFEWNVGIGFSWLCYFGQWGRLGKREKDAYYGTFLGWGVFICISTIFGAFTALLVGSSDPVDWMMSSGGAVLGFLGLVLLVIANIMSITMLIYTQGISFKTMFPTMNWKWACLTTVPAIFLMISPKFYDGYGSFLAFISYIMAPFSAIILVDFFFLRKQKVKLRELYDRKGEYQFSAGFNPSAWITVILSTILYWNLYNPVTFSGTMYFEYLSAGIPTYVFAFIIYYILSKCIFTSWARI
jgi:NCS1 family nucleobase:cation symporter-1